MTADRADRPQRARLLAPRRPRVRGRAARLQRRPSGSGDGPDSASLHHDQRGDALHRPVGGESAPEPRRRRLCAVAHRGGDPASFRRGSDPDRRRRKLSEVLGTVAAAMSGHPMRATGVLVGRRSDGTIGPLHPTRLPPEMTGAVPGGPWDRTHMSESEVDHVAVAALPGPVARSAREHGFAAVWGRSTDDGDPDTCPWSAGAWRRRRAQSESAAAHEAGRGDRRDSCLRHRTRSARSWKRWRTPIPSPGSPTASDSPASPRWTSRGLRCSISTSTTSSRSTTGSATKSAISPSNTLPSVCDRSSGKNDDVVRLGGDEFVVICRPPC